MRRETVVERMRNCVFSNPDTADRLLELLCKEVLAHLMATALAATWIPGQLGGRNQPLPAELTFGTRVLSFQSIRQLHSAVSGLQITNVLSAYAHHLFHQLVAAAIRQYRYSVFLSLARAHQDVSLIKTNILDRSCRHSLCRRPAPYITRNISRFRPVNCGNSFEISSRLNTTGSLAALVADTTSRKVSFWFMTF